MSRIKNYLLAEMVIAFHAGEVNEHKANYTSYKLKSYVATTRVLSCIKLLNYKLQIINNNYIIIGCLFLLFIRFSFSCLFT